MQGEEQEEVGGAEDRGNIRMTIQAGTMLEEKGYTISSKNDLSKNNKWKIFGKSGLEEIKSDLEITRYHQINKTGNRAALSMTLIRPGIDILPIIEQDFSFLTS